MRRRTVLRAVAGTAAVSLAGCSLLTEDEGEAAEPAGVGDSAIEETAFEHDTLESSEYTETVEIAGESEDLTLTNWTNRYIITLPEIDLDAASFSLFSTPTVTVADQDANPFQVMDDDVLLEAMVDRLDTGPVEDIERIGDREVMVLDGTSTIDEYRGQTEQDGVDVRLDLGHRTHEGDLLVLWALYPDHESDQFSNATTAILDRPDDIDTLAAAIQHPIEPDS